MKIITRKHFWLSMVFGIIVLFATIIIIQIMMVRLWGFNYWSSMCIIIPTIIMGIVMFIHGGYISYSTHFGKWKGRPIDYLNIHRYEDRFLRIYWNWVLIIVLAIAPLTLSLISILAFRSISLAITFFVIAFMASPALYYYLRIGNRKNKDLDIQDNSNAMGGT